MKLSKKTIEFCDKPRHFKRCPNKQLKEAMKGVEGIQKDMENSLDGVKKDVDKVEELRKEATLLFNDIETSKDNDRLIKDEKELEKRVLQREKDNKKALKLIKQAEKIEADLEKKTDKINAKVKEIDGKLITEYGKVCEQLLEPFAPGEFEENYDSIDMTIAKNLPMFYDLYMGNISENKIDNKLKQLIEAEHSEASEFR
ncbi:hypothetical protein DSECCO2_631650 [anaerobic digester metagenome]